MSRLNKEQTLIPKIGETNSSEQSEDDFDFTNNNKRLRLELDFSDKESIGDDSVEETMNENTATEKRPNFSAINPNCVRIPAIINLKPGATKKLIIKNFKSKYCVYAQGNIILTDAGINIEIQGCNNRYIASVIWHYVLVYIFISVIRFSLS